VEGRGSYSDAAATTCFSLHIDVRPKFENTETTKWLI